MRSFLPLRSRKRILRTAEAAWKASRYGGSGLLLDITGNGYDLQFGSASDADANDPTFSAGRIAFTTNDYLIRTVANEARLSPGLGSFTALYYGNKSTVGTTAGLIGNRTVVAATAGSASGWIVNPSSTGAVAFRCSDGTSVYSVSLTLGAWANSADAVIACVVDRTANEIRVYVDGVQPVAATSISGAGSFSNATPKFCIGAAGAGTPTAFAEGSLAAAAIFTRALSQAEIVRAGAELRTP